jgi:uncharacterized protein YbbC (DUF1343 family)
MLKNNLHFFLFLLFSCSLIAENKQKVTVGIEILLKEETYFSLLKGKKIGLITNHTAVNSKLEKTITLLKQHAKNKDFAITTIFAPEHGINGAAHREDQLCDDMDPDGIPIYCLYGKNWRPSKVMLEQIDLLLYDIQDIGTRSYTYITTLFYIMEEAAKYKIPVIVLDRPNPINGIAIDGPLLEEKWRSPVGYINVPYCHGMTVGELAHFFNEEYDVGCSLKVVPMKGWQRHMSFLDTGLAWIPTSPQIPEASTALYYPMTGLIGELKFVSIGIGYTLPFKVVGAPWIDADVFAKCLNDQNFPGITFQPFHFRPFYGRYAHQECHGVLLIITDTTIYKPVTTQYLVIGILKSLYPSNFYEAIQREKNWKEMFCKVNGTEEVCRILTNEKYVVWKLKELHQVERSDFAKKRQKYLIPDYID